MLSEYSFVFIEQKWIFFNQANISQDNYVNYSLARKPYDEFTEIYPRNPLPL